MGVVRTTGGSVGCTASAAATAVWVAHRETMVCSTEGVSPTVLFEPGRLQEERVKIMIMKKTNMEFLRLKNFILPPFI
jgi:hypothetical protein